MSFSGFACFFFGLRVSFFFLPLLPFRRCFVWWWRVFRSLRFCLGIRDRLPSLPLRSRRGLLRYGGLILFFVCIVFSLSSARTVLFRGRHGLGGFFYLLLSSFSGRGRLSAWLGRWVVFDAAGIATDGAAMRCDAIRILGVEEASDGCGQHWASRRGSQDCDILDLGVVFVREDCRTGEPHSCTDHCRSAEFWRDWVRVPLGKRCITSSFLASSRHPRLDAIGCGGWYSPRQVLGFA